MAGLELWRVPGSDPVDPTGRRRILELGCGLGVASVVIHRRGGDVTATDLHPLAGAFLLANTALNALSPIAYQQRDWADATAVVGVFDVIIGSDLLYERHQAASLAACIVRNGRAGTEVIIVDPGRGHGSHFVRALEAAGFTGTATPVSARRYAGIPYHGTVYGYRLAV